MAQRNPTIEQVYTRPWRYVGYAGFAKFCGSDSDFFAVRRFDSLAARVILSRQWQLTKLETDLSNLDFQRSHEVIEDYNNGSFEKDTEERRELIRDIDNHLNGYYKLLNAYITLRKCPEASYHVKGNMQGWLTCWGGCAIDKDETSFVYGHDDLFALTETPRTPLRRALERFESFRTNHLLRRSPKEVGSETKYPYDSEGTIYLNDTLVDSLVTIITCATGFLMLIIPLWILIFVSGREQQLAVITAFVALFLGLLQSVTVARPFESLAATAAYSAVLMVFMQIPQSDN